MTVGSGASLLDKVPLNKPYSVRSVNSPAAAPERGRQLDEIGFFPGEQVMVLARGFPGGDPMVVRVGQSTFALRCAEAACVHVEPAAAEPAA
jgi:ferrous iron transport protein A